MRTLPRGTQPSTYASTQGGFPETTDEVQKYLPSHTDQRSTLNITIGWLVLAVYLDDLKRRLVVNTFKLHHYESK